MAHVKPFVPIIYRARTIWGRVFLTLCMVASLFIFSMLVDRAMAGAPPDAKVQPYVWAPHRSKVLPKHTLHYHVRDRYGDYVPAHRRGHKLCKKGTYLVNSKYTGISCATKKGTRKVAKVMIHCTGLTALGYAWGGLAGAGAGLSGCGFEMLGW